MTARLLRPLLLGLGVLLTERFWRRSGQHTLEREQFVPAPRQRVFDFFADPRNLPAITPPSIGFRVVRLETVPLEGGTLQEYRIRWFGLPLRWESLIAEYTYASDFTDVQLRGPYRAWRHVHRFEDAPGGTLVRDRVDYELPFGIIGRLAHALAVRRQLRQIFDYRERAIAQALADG